MKTLITILGSTGSIGLSVLSILEKKKNLFKINILLANKNLKLICYQIRRYKPKIYVVQDIQTYHKIKKKFSKNKTRIVNSLAEVSQIKKSDLTVSAIPGVAGLQPTLFMIKKSKKILIANKESIICGWKILNNESKKFNTKIIPIDSEHYSIFNLLKGHKIDDVKRVYLTASGGPFLNYKSNQLKNISPKEALRHPKWKMGKKISIDSSTLMNKMLEVIEAQRLFSIPEKKIDILIHPDSLVHAIIQFKNGLTKFLYHETSMKIPISNAIFNGKLDIKDFYKFKINENKIINNLKFMKVDKNTFPIIKIKHRLNELPSTPIIINACNEILVDQFLQKKIKFSSISKIIMSILNDKNYTKYAIRSPKNVNQIIKIDNWALMVTLKKIK